MKEEDSNMFSKTIIEEYDFTINNISFEYSIINLPSGLSAWCTSSDLDVNIIMPYFQTPDIIINYLKELGINENDLNKIERMTFEYLT